MINRPDDGPDRPGARRELHTILRVSNIGGREVRFHKDGLVLIWDGKLMRYRPLEPGEIDSVRSWLNDLTKAVKDHQSPKK